MILDYISSTGELPFEQQLATSFTSELQWSTGFLVGTVLKGSLSIHYKKHTRRFGLYDIFFFKPFEEFSVISSEDGTQALLLVVNATYVAGLCTDVNRLEFRQNHLNQNLSNKIYTDICEDIAIIIFNNLKQELCSKMKLLTSITRIVTTLFESFGVLHEDIPGANYQIERSIHILEYISGHYAEKITVTEIAGHLGLHPQYFSTLFHRQFGMSFVEYLTNYRINRSIAELIHTDKSILEIALNHGFGSHKTYATAFRRLYASSPTEYRRLHREPPADQIPEYMKGDARDDTIGIFAYFRQFLREDIHSLQFTGQILKRQTIELDTLSLSPKSSMLNQERFLSVGRAFACLRREVQEQILAARKDFGFEYLRFRDIFSDDLYVYYEDENKNPLFSWQALDSIFDFLVTAGIKPFPEIGYMPNMLASRRQFAGVQYHPNTSAPKSLNIWKELIRQFLTHYIERYGAAEVRGWYFDFWTSPDLQIKNPYWGDSMEDFFRFYQVTYEAFQEVDGKLRLGSPNFSTISGYPWYEAFFQFCYTNRIYPAYVSFHVYGAEARRDAKHQNTFQETRAEDYSFDDPNHIESQLLMIHQIMNRLGFRMLDVIVSDWNLTFLPRDYIRDTCYMGPFICHTIIRNIRLVKGWSFWALSDIHEEAFPDSKLFAGGPGLLDYHGLKKASYNTFTLLGKIAPKILEAGDNYILTQEADRFQLLIYNLGQFDYMFSHVDSSAMDSTHRYNIYSNSDSLYVSIALTLPEGSYYIKKSEVNRSYGSAYDLWGEIGAPAVLHKEIEDYIRENSIPKVTYSVQDVDQTLLLDEIVPCHGVMLLEIMPR